jgi:Spy/CpxP family protein refolding chaperone
MSRLMIGALVLVLALLGAVYSQDEKPPTKGRPSLPTYYGKLKLSEEQKAQVRKVQAEYRDKLTALQDQIKKLKAEEKTALAKLLTPAQRKLLRELQTGEKSDKDNEKSDKPKEKEKN